MIKKLVTKLRTGIKNRAWKRIHLLPFLIKETDVKVPLYKKIGFWLIDEGHAYKECVLRSDKKLTYVLIAKVACSSIKKSLMLESGDMNFGEIHRYYSNPANILVNYDTPHHLNKGYYSFAFVRNPYDRLYSCYKNKVAAVLKESETFYYKDFLWNYLKKDICFEQFVKKIVLIPDSLCDPHLQPQHYSVINDKKKYRPDFIGRFENLAADFEPIRARFDLHKLEHRNQSQTHKDEWKDYYTKELVDLVYQKYKKDFELWYPNARQELLEYLEANQK